MSAASTIDNVGFFDRLAELMNGDPERYRLVGDANMALVIVMHRAEGDFCVRLDFDGICCDGVAEIDAADVARADFALVGEIADWQAMFDDIATNGRATGLQTINSLALLGDHIACEGADPMGLDKFSRFNQTIQQFLDGSAQLALAAGQPS
jgi:hypothetical protein